MSAPAAPEASRARGRAARALVALLAAAVAVPFAGCLRGTTFQCASNGDCTGSPAGRCESVGYCSFPDTSCPAGSRFGDHSGPFAGQCVDQLAGGDGGIDAPMSNCAGYTALAGVATHRYRAILVNAIWTAQRTTCTDEGGYLVEPGDAAEMTAVNMLAGAVEIWVGVTDQATEGTFLTGRGAAPTFLPWENNQPDDAPQGGADCVRAVASGTYADDRCNTVRRAVCECDL